MDEEDDSRLGCVTKRKRQAVPEMDERRRGREFGTVSCFLFSPLSSSLSLPWASCLGLASAGGGGGGQNDPPPLHHLSALPRRAKGAPAARKGRGWGRKSSAANGRGGWRRANHALAWGIQSAVSQTHPSHLPPPWELSTAPLCDHCASAALLLCATCLPLFSSPLRLAGDACPAATSVCAGDGRVHA